MGTLVWIAQQPLWLACFVSLGAMALVSIVWSRTLPSAETIRSNLGGDEVVDKGGVKFIIDPSAIMFLLGSTIDWKEEKFKQGFTFENPNETARCGCGESFSTS